MEGWCSFVCRRRGIQYRGRDEAVCGWFSQIGIMHAVHHLWGEMCFFLLGLTHCFLLDIFSALAEFEHCCLWQNYQHILQCMSDFNKEYLLLLKVLLLLWIQCTNNLFFWIIHVGCKASIHTLHDDPCITSSIDGLHSAKGVKFRLAQTMDQLN